MEVACQKSKDAFLQLRRFTKIFMESRNSYVQLQACTPFSAYATFAQAAAIMNEIGSIRHVLRVPPIHTSLWCPPATSPPLPTPARLPPPPTRHQPNRTRTMSGAAPFVAPTLTSPPRPRPPPWPTPQASPRRTNSMVGTLRCSHTALWCPISPKPARLPGPAHDASPRHRPVTSQIGPVVRFWELNGWNQCTLHCSHTALWCPASLALFLGVGGTGSALKLGNALGRRRPWPWLCHGADASAADPASLDLRFSKGPSRTPFQDHSKIDMGFGSESQRHGGISEAFLGSQTVLKTSLRGPSGPEHHFLEVGGVPEGAQFEKRAPNDADDAGPRGLHHQHHWGSVSPIWTYQAAAIWFFRVLYDGFWLAPGVVKLKITTSGPNPWFWAQNHGFWARCGHVWCKLLQNNQK